MKQAGNGGPGALSGRRCPLPARDRGYAKIQDYAVLGDGRSIALVALDGQVDWWPTPTIGSPPLLGSLLDPPTGGHFCLKPAGPCEVSRSYLPGTNVLETFYWGDDGVVRVTEALSTGLAGRLPWSELARDIAGVEGEMEMTWELVPGSRFGAANPVISSHNGAPLIKVGDQMMALVLDGAGDVELGADRISGRLRARAGHSALLAAVVSHKEPLFVGRAGEIRSRLDRTVRSWCEWSDLVGDQGLWTEAVKRSALALKTLRSEADGAIAAAGTTSLPERVGGPKNYDYRFAWIRDTSFTLDAFMELGLHEEVHASVSWMLAALRRNGPGLRVFYTLAGEEPGEEVHPDVPGYKGSLPVRVGNSARSQRQLGVYGDLFDMIARYVDGGHVLDDGTAAILSDLADRCVDEWREKDSGLWELDDLQHYTISKIGCWVAMDRACQLAAAGQLPRARMGRWDREREAIKRWIYENCWSKEQEAFTFYAGTQKLDAAVLLAGRTGFSRGEPLATTIEAVKRELGAGRSPLLYRYSGMQDEEGAFVACSFWLVSALAHNGQVERARQTMDQAVRLSNDVGLLSEQVDPASGDFLGNIPQGLSHLALVQAAHAVRANAPNVPREAPVG